MPSKTYNQILDEHLHILIAQGNHEAFIVLRRRYRRHAYVLCTSLLNQYSDTGITNKELFSVCDAHFILCLNRYVPGLSSFYTFWKESTQQILMDYIVENSYDSGAYLFRGIVSFDQALDEKHNYAEYLAEKTEDKKFKRTLLEIKRIIQKYDVFFTAQEKALLNLILEGYSVCELEHTGMLGKSHLYLTYNCALEKLKHIVLKNAKYRANMAIITKCKK